MDKTSGPFHFMETTNINALLDRVAAELGEYGNGDGKPTLADCARETKLSPKMMWEWVKQRSRIPNGEATLRLLAWADKRARHGRPLKITPDIGNTLLTATRSSGKTKTPKRAIAQNETQ